MSIDGGYNWLNKLGNWVTVMGAFGSGIVIVPVWTES